MHTGYDGALDIDTLSRGFIQHADLSEEGLWLGRRWDWVMSVEVGEHIARENEDYFLDNLVRHACRGGEGGEDGVGGDYFLDNLVRHACRGGGRGGWEGRDILGGRCGHTLVMTYVVM